MLQNLGTKAPLSQEYNVNSFTTHSHVYSSLMLVNGHIDMQAEASYTLHVPAQIFDS